MIFARKMMITTLGYWLLTLGVTWAEPIYKVAAETHYAPFIFIDEKGKIQGFDPDLLKAIGEKEGFKVVFQSELWDQMFEKLDKGEVDIIAAGLAESPARREKYGVSDGYAKTRRIALFSNPAFKNKTINELSGLRYVTQSGTTNVDYLKKLYGENANIQGEQTQYLQVKALMKGETDIVYDDFHVLVTYLNRYKGQLYAIEDTLVGSNWNFVILTQKSNQELLNKINSGLKAVRADGTYQRLYDKWFKQN